MLMVRSNTKLRRRHVLLWASSAGALTSCGFQLRQAPNLAFSTLFGNFSESSSLANELRRGIESTGVRVITDARQIDTAQVILDVLLDQREKSVVGVNSSGLVREFQLRVRFKFRLRDKTGKELISETELLQQRDFSYTESAALSKEAEEAILYRSMQTDIVQQALRRLSSVTAI
jgi:LPS-assembly lipoprotein